MAALSVLLLAPAVRAAVPWPTLNAYGEPGLLQTPTARFDDEGTFAIGLSSSHPYNRIFLTHQPLPWLSATFRYTEITNRLYSPDSEFSGDQSYKDRGFDVRLRLISEGPYRPAIVLGLRDLGGTSLFGAEYLVASRRYYDFDFSLGLGWGRLGSGGELKNPLMPDTARESSSGDFNASSLFAGERVGIFGGLAWRTPIRGLMLVAEHDSNDYKNEPLDNPQPVHNPINLGAVYKPRPWFEATIGWERGDTVTGRIAFLTNFATEQGIPKLFDPPLPPVPARTDLGFPPLPCRERGRGEGRTPSSPPTQSPCAQAPFAAALQQSLHAQSIPLEAAGLSPDATTATAVVSGGPYRDPTQVADRAARSLAAAAPRSVEWLKVRQVEQTLPLYEATVQRSELEGLAETNQPTRGALHAGTAKPDLESLVVIPAKAGIQGLEERPSARPGSQKGSKPAPINPYADLSIQGLRKYPDFDWQMGPAIRQHIGGPDSFYFGQLWWRIGADLEPLPGLNLSSAVGINVYNNFDGLKLPSDSELPHVRSDIVQYLQQGETALVRLETNYFHTLASGLYGRLSAGIFEEMYGGIAGEVLYRPFGSTWAVGANVNRVRQREFDGRFDFRNYEVTTGHLTNYIQWPNPTILIKLSIGQYLAGDRGATLDVSRKYANGIRAGMFATKTNVAAEQFGEGSFDKGFYIYIPFDLFLPRSSRQSATLMFRPLTRDGGQIVRDGQPLYSLVER